MKLLTRAQPFHLAAVLLSLIPIYIVYLYMHTYGLAAPTDDQWLTPVQIAFHTQNGSLTLGDIVEAYEGGHRTVFYRAVTAGLAYATRWDVKLEMYLNLLLALLRFGLVVMIFHQHHPKLTYAILLPFSLLVFSTYQFWGWLSGIYAVWHFVSLFWLATIWVLRRFAVGWRTLLVAAFLALCATFQQGSGLVTFPVFWLTLWMFGYRRLQYYLFWSGTTLVALGLYLYGIDLSPSSAGEPSLIAKLLHPKAWLYVITFFGNPFSYIRNVSLAAVVGASGCLLWGANFWYLSRPKRDWPRFAAWFTLAGLSIGTALMGYTVRYTSPLYAATGNRYVLASTHFWFGLGAMVLITTWQQRTMPLRLWERLLSSSNILFSVLLLGLYLQSNIWMVQTTAFHFGWEVFAKRESRYTAPEYCLLAAPLSRDLTCFGLLGRGVNVDSVYLLAYYRLAIFRQQAAVPLLPPAYKIGSPLVLDTPSPWMNAYLRQWYLQPAQEANLFHIAPQESEKSLPITILRDPLIHLAHDYSGATPAQLAAFIADAPTVWYLRTRETEANEAAFSQIMRGLGYLPTAQPSNDPRYNTQLFLTRFDKPPPPLENPPRFGESILLYGWQLSDSLGNPQDCRAAEVLTLQSWWQTDAILASNFSLRFAVLNEYNEIVSESNGGLTPVPNPFWQIGQLYLDERSLAFDCALPRGEYRLTVSLADSAGTPQLADGSPFFELTSFSVPR